MNRHSKVSGFSLIEVLIVVAIIGILSAIAFPSYSDYVRKTRRSEAVMEMLTTIQDLERCKAQKYAYTDCRFSNGSVTAPGNTSDYFIFKLTNLGASTYTVRAQAKGAQLDDTDCYRLFINQIGVKWARTSGGVNTNDICWD